MREREGKRENTVVLKYGIILYLFMTRGLRIIIKAWYE